MDLLIHEPDLFLHNHLNFAGRIVVSLLFILEVLTLKGGLEKNHGVPEEAQDFFWGVCVNLDYIWTGTFTVSADDVAKSWPTFATHQLPARCHEQCSVPEVH